MDQKLVNTITKIIIAVALSVPAYAQNGDGSSAALSGPRRQLSVIIFSGLAGAVLGLSTLSFYGRPQDKLSNIAIGAAIGVIGGATYTSYKAATDPYQALDISEVEQHLMSTKKLAALPSTPNLSYQWTF